MRKDCLGWFAVAAIFGLVFGTTGCSKQTKSDSQPTGGQQAKKTQQEKSQGKTVVLYEYRFNPNSLTVEKGTKVTFKNKDQEKHNVQISALDVDQNIEAGGAWDYTFNTTGEFAVGNRLSSKPMKMTIVVEE